MSSPMAISARPMTATACCEDKSGVLSEAAFSFSFFSASVFLSASVFAPFLSFLSAGASFSGSKCSLEW